MDTVKDVADRIEFYISEENIQQDGVLSAMANQNENKFIPLGEIMSFPDIRGFDVSIDDVKNELLQRGNVHLSPDGNEISLESSCNDLDNETRRTIRYSGIPLETTEDDLISAFSSIPNVESIQIRKNLLTHQFCGVVHVILKTESLVPDVLKIAVEVNGVYIFKKQTLNTYLNGNIEKEKKYEYFSDCLFVLKNLPPTNRKEIDNYLRDIIPSTANYVYDEDQNFCAVHFAQPGDSIACCRTINSTPFKDTSIVASKLQPRTKKQVWERYIELVRLSDNESFSFCYNIELV